MKPPDKRRFPRIAHVASSQIVRLDAFQNPVTNLVLTKNLSPCGIRFTTYQKIASPCTFLLYLNDILIKDLNQNSQGLLKSGDHFLCQVIWSKRLSETSYEVGATFLEKKKCSAAQIETFTELVNISMLDLLPEHSARA